jgi:hypothetical protein
MKLDPKAINNALTLAKKVATKIDPGFGGVKPPIPGIGVPLLRKSGGRAGFAAGGSPDPSTAPDFADSLYSHGQRVAETLPPTAQPEQMRSMLQQNGVKGSEMKWSGVNDDLSHPGELSGPDVARAFSMNMAYPEEKVLRNVSRREHQAMTERHQREQDHLFANAPEDANEGGEALRELRRRHQMERRNLENIEYPHHEYYTLPGGKNYREILLRHPTSASGEADYSNRDHFGGEPNIIASLRMKDRIDEGTGAPIAHLEELQSDWGQGARHGYQGQPEKTAARDALKAFEEELKSNHASVTDKPFEPIFSALMQDKGKEHDSLRYDAARERQAMEGRPKEPAPFIDKTEDWAGLGLKRALFEAAHGGHDKLAWTPGEDQYARFSDPREPEKTRAQRLAGMKSFYDQMLPKRLLQIARQHDPEAHLTTAAVKIPHGEEDFSETKSLPALRITDRMRESIKKNGFPMYQRGGAVDGYADGGEADDQIDYSQPDSYMNMYSKAAQIASQLPMKRATPAEWKGALLNRGVKPAEIKWSEFEQRHPGNKPISREDVAKHFDTWRPNIHETDLRGPETQYEQWTMPGGENYREVLLHEPEPKTVRHQHSHWTDVGGNGNPWDDEDGPKDIPNVYVHARLKDREAPSGKKVLHVEELQSDWGQDGRKGFRDPDPSKVPQDTEALKRRKDFFRDLSQRTGIPINPNRPFPAAYEAAKQTGEMETVFAHNRDVNIEAAANARRMKMPAEGPYVGSTNDWVDLGLKHLLTHAAMNDHEHLAWTPGEAQANRYVAGGDDHEQKVAMENGMRRFYDEILPKRLLKLAQMHDPDAQLSNVGVSTRRAYERPYFENTYENLPSLPITPKMRESIKKHGFPMYQRGGAVDGYAGGGSTGGDESPSAYLEVAPGESYDAEQKRRWEMLHPVVKSAISEKMLREFLPKWEKHTGITGDVLPGLGGFMGDTNPNYAYRPHNPEHISKALNGLGSLLRQDAMMGASSRPFEGSTPKGIVRVHIPKEMHPDKIHNLYRILHDQGLAEGHSTDLRNGTMDIMHDSHPAAIKASAKIHSLLGGQHDVETFPAHISFPSHGVDYDTVPSGREPSEPSIQAPSNPLQAEAAERLQQHIDAAHAGGGAQVGRPEHFKKGGKVDPSYAEDPGLFDLSSLHETPKVKQFDLPRYVPARGVSPRVSDLVSNKDVFDRAMELTRKGRQMGGERWYNADPLRLAFMKENGPEKGDQMFRKYMDFVAATSPRSEVGTNVRNASYYFSRYASGHGLPEVGEKNPQPYGHLAQQSHQMNAHRVAGEGWDPLNNPKPASFAQNLMGNQAPVAVDTHAFRLPAILSRDPRFLETSFQSSSDKPKQNIRKIVKSGELSPEDAAKRAAYWQAMPKENEYGAMEQFYKRLAQEFGITPAQAQASAWVGGGHITGLASDESKPFMGFMQDRIMKTAGDTNMEPKDVLQKFVRGEMPLRASGGPVNRALSIAKKAKKK